VTGPLWSIVLLAGGLVGAAIGELVSEEIRGWLDLVPRGILRLAARRLTPSIRRGTYEDVWLPDLVGALKGADARPITRLLVGIRFAGGLFFAAHRINREAMEAAAWLPNYSLDVFLANFANYFSNLVGITPSGHKIFQVRYAAHIAFFIEYDVAANGATRVHRIDWHELPKGTVWRSLKAPW
jgi:hypothetical protein